MNFRPELLAPAGTYRSMRHAFAYGADAVYAGQPRYSLRVRNNDFTLDSLAEGIAEAHARGRKFYVACNIAPHNDKVRRFIDDLVPVMEADPDALIMSDPGMIMLVRDRWPDAEIHLSVQANATNFATVEFWRRQGLRRVILSRELALEEIEDIRRKCPEMELEVFVHGALCIAYSGRCLLSGYMNHRDPNQGACTNACRWQYDLVPGQEDETGEVRAQAVSTYDPGAAAQPLLLRERENPDRVMPVMEDEHGTYILNSKDLRAVQHVERLAAMGVHSLKIEGRTKSHFYVSRTVQVYRRALDDAAAGRAFDMGLMDVLEGLSNRGYTEGFYRRHPPGAFQNYEQGQSRSDRQQFVGEVIEEDSDWLTIEVKNRFSVGDQLELMTPAGNCTFDLQAMQGRAGAAVEVAPGSGHRVKIPRPTPEPVGDYALVLRNLMPDAQVPGAALG
ncbi:MAG: tRNA 5-hydroxyuridine modification protein YegQ [Pseudomonadota bacterium]|nr:tRNA 5-hydroxyuridine modification protein YegQ [Pseudomonadota bacterium]